MKTSEIKEILEDSIKTSDSLGKMIERGQKTKSYKLDRLFWVSESMRKITKEVLRLRKQVGKK